MNDIVIIPTYDRPEYLWVCLEKLEKTGSLDGKEIWICEDQHIDKPKHFTTQVEMLATIREAERLFKNDRLKYFMISHQSYGNSNNLLSALDRAYDTSAKYVYIIEDDVMVTPDFFQWHEEAHKTFDPFVTCAGRINRSLNFQMNGPEAIDESNPDSMACVRSHKAYMSWANCFRRDRLHRFLKEWPYDDEWRPGHEQDIAIQQWMWMKHEDSVWPYVPRAYHMGWYSYHRTAGMKFNGTLEEKVKELRSAITDKTKINQMASLQEIDPFPTKPIMWREGGFYLKADYK